MPPLQFLQRGAHSRWLLCALCLAWRTVAEHNWHAGEVEPGWVTPTQVGYTSESWWKPFNVTGHWNETEYAQRLKVVLMWNRQEQRRLQARKGCTEGKPAANLSECCTRNLQEATDECNSFAQFGFTDATCAAWRSEVWRECNLECGDCEQTSIIVFEICKFTLQVLRNGALIAAHCKAVQDNFRLRRCPTACHVPDFICFDGNSTECMGTCGNYMPCRCAPRRGTLLEDTCSINTKPVNPGYVPGFPGKNYTCDMKPLTCMHHREDGMKCALHRYCAPNLCIINNVTCKKPYQCADAGVCKPDEGLCFFSDIKDGSLCNDEISYTVRDQCIRGICVGTVDYCLKYNVTCAPADTCLTGGTCHPNSGMCTYVPKADGSFCDDGRPYTVEDRCMSGMCVGKEVDLCNETGIICKAPNVCHKVPTCDIRSGKCSLPAPQDNDFPCDDGDPLTHNDSCSDGLCIGSTLTSNFETLGEGECSDRNQLLMSRYLGDTATEAECEKVCTDDAQCRAFNYGYPTCSIWGTVRNKAPSRRWTFMLGSVPTAAILIEDVAPVAKGQRKGICRRKSESGDTVKALPGGKIDVADIFSFRVMATFFTLLLLCFFLLPCVRCWKVCCCGPRATQIVAAEEVATGVPMVSNEKLRIAGDNDLPPPSPRDSATLVAANPESPDATPWVLEDVDAAPPDPDVAPPPMNSPTMLQMEQTGSSLCSESPGKWKRKNKAPQGAKEGAPPSSGSAELQQQPGHTVGVSPADIANTGQYGGAAAGMGATAGVAGLGGLL